jgi:hypothetical protein
MQSGANILIPFYSLIGDNGKQAAFLTRKDGAEGLNLM